MAARGAVALIVAGGLLTAVAGFAAVRDGEGRTGRGVYDPRAEAMEGIAARLEAQERSLDRRERSVEEREHELRAIEERLGERSAALEEMRTSIDAMRQEVDEAHAERVAAVVRTVEAMKPTAAALMIEKLDGDLAIEVLQQMSERKSGKLFAALPPELAARLAEGIAGPGGAVGADGVDTP